MDFAPNHFSNNTLSQCNQLQCCAAHSPKSELHPVWRIVSFCSKLQGWLSHLTPPSSFAGRVYKQPFPVHLLLVTSDLIHLSHIPLLSFLSQPGEPLLIQKLFHTSDYPCRPSWYCFCVSCIPSKLRGPDVNTHLGCRHSMSLCDGNMLFSVLIFMPFLIIPNFQYASVINNKLCDDVFTQQTIRNLRTHSCEVAITLEAIILYMKLGLFFPCTPLHVSLQWISLTTSSSHHSLL